MRLKLGWVVAGRAVGVSSSAHSAHSHIFLGFSKCGRYVLSYTSSSGDDDFSFYIYHLYWWEFNVHSKLKLVGLGLLFQQALHWADPSDSRPQLLLYHSACVLCVNGSAVPVGRPLESC